jgi:hypothetical protein
MKELYTFTVNREIEKEVPCVRKKAGKDIESTKKVKEKINHRIVIEKPNISEIENAEFFYGQKFNEYINAGFLTRAMLSKKMGDLGGMGSKQANKRLESLLLENVEAARAIEFYGGAKKLTKEQEEKLKDSKEKFLGSKKEIHEYEMSIRDQFSQTADAKAEQKLIEWFVFNFSYFEDIVDDKKELFSLFEGENFNERRRYFLNLSDSDSEIKDTTFLKHKNIFEDAYENLIRAISIWYNKMGNDQESIEKTMKELFDNEQKDEKGG